ncbi:MAG: hypothetical protein AAF551_02220 [Bacteroidota bacterium]
MKKLSFLIHALSKEETDLIVKYYLMRNSYSKRLKLFNLIKMEGVGDDLEASKRLYNRKPNAAFCQLKKRLNEDILNLLVAFDYQSEDPKDFISAEAQATKYVLQAKTLLKKGLNHEAISLLKKAFHLTEEHEAYEVQALAHAVLRAYSDETIIEEVGELERRFSRNVDTFYQLMNLRLDRKVTISSIKGSYEEETDIGTKKKKQVKAQLPDSLRLKFQYASKALEKFLEQGEYEQSLKLTENILPFIENGDHALTSRQKAAFYLNLSKAFLGLHRYERSAFFGEKSAQLFASFEEKKVEAFLVVYKSYFYLNDLEKAKEVLQLCSDFGDFPNDTRGELSLFNAYHTFCEEDYRGSLKVLNSFFKQSKLDINLVLSGKLLELLNLLEMQDYEWFDYKLENFRKSVYYHAQINLSERFSLICKAFFSLKKFSYSKNQLKCHVTNNNWLTRLSETSGSCTWDPLGTELIPVHFWLTR